MTINKHAEWKSRLAGANIADVFNAMAEVVSHGDPDLIPLLQYAGTHVSEAAKKLPITMPAGKFTFEQFRQYCIERLQAGHVHTTQAPKQDLGRQLRVFISYNHRDREVANDIALELSRSKVIVFIDHWEMNPTDRILERIETEMHASDYVILLLSPRSVASAWVQTELKYAIMRQEKEGRVFLIPVLLEDCELPTDVSDRPYYDWRTEQKRPAVIQAIVNTIQGTKPFSHRVRDFLTKQDSWSPYKRNIQNDGRRLLSELAKYTEMEIANNQKWLLWELFHILLVRYPCTMKVGPLGADGITFAIVDRWNETLCGVRLTREEFEQGLWSGELDLLANVKGSAWRGSGVIGNQKLKFLGRQGLLSWDRAYNPNVRSNPAEPSAQQPMSRVLKHVQELGAQIETNAQQSFLYDYQRLVLPADWPKVKVVAGSASCDITLAFSSMSTSESSEKPWNGAVFEFYHPFFGSLKVTQIYTKQLDHQWEGDTDLFSPQTETLLGLA